MTEFMTDHRGARVPKSKIRAEKLLQDELVKKLVASAEALNKALAAFKVSALGEVAAFRDLVAQEYDVSLGGRKGNLTLRTFDGTAEVQVAIGESIAFGPELDAAKALIDECVREWSEGANDNIRALVEHAFQTNKQGRIDTHRVLGLRQLAIEDAKWQRAMEAISDAVQVVGSKTYLRVYRRDPETEVLSPVSLDLASV